MFAARGLNIYRKGIVIKVKINNSKYYFLFVALSGLLFCGFVIPFQKGKKLKGHFYENACLVDQVEGEKKCRVDSGKGVVISILQQLENPQFGGESEAELLIWLPEWPPVGGKYYLKKDNYLLCYQERGELLLFETFTGSGWLLIDGNPEKGKLVGGIELNLIEPHHNFSNSDFQFIGGNLSLKMGEIRK